MTRAEHLQWAKERALEYCDRGDLAQAMASFISDMRKHPELENHIALKLGFEMQFYGFLNGNDKVRKWIEGFR